MLEIPISYENAVDNDGSPECEFIPKTLPKQTDSVECDKKVGQPDHGAGEENILRFISFCYSTTEC